MNESNEDTDCGVGFLHLVGAEREEQLSDNHPEDQDTADVSVVSGDWASI